MTAPEILTQKDVDEWLDKTEIHDHVGVNTPLYIKNGLLLRREKEGSPYYVWHYVARADAFGLYNGKYDYMRWYAKRDDLPSLKAALKWYEENIYFEVKVGDDEWKDIREIKRLTMVP